MKNVPLTPTGDLSTEAFKSVLDEEFQVKTQKAGPELWVPMGFLGLVAILVTVASVQAGLTTWVDLIMLPIIGGALGASYPGVRRMMRNNNYREYLKSLEPGQLQEIDDSDLDWESRQLARQLLDNPSTFKRCAERTNKAEG